MKCPVLVTFYVFIFSFSFVFVYADKELRNNDNNKNNVTLISSFDSVTDNNNKNENKRTEKRSSQLHQLPSSSSLLIKDDDDVSAMDRIQIPIIYHTSIGGKANSYHNFKSDINPHSFVFNSNIKPLRKPHHSSATSSHHQSLLTNQGPQIFPLQQNTFPPVIQPNSFNTYSAQSYSSHFPPTSQASSSNNPITKHPDLLYYQNFDKLCPASKPYPVYIEKKVPVTVEKRVPYPVKVPYPVHHYHYDNVEHRNFNAEDLKDGTPPPPPPLKESRDPPPKVGGLFTEGDKGGFKGDTKEEMYDNYDENNGGERTEDEEEYYDHYEKSSSREIPRNVPRNANPNYSNSNRNNGNNNKSNIKIRNNRENGNTNNNRNTSRYNNNNNQQQQNKSVFRKAREDKVITDRNDDSRSLTFEDLKKENITILATTTEKIIPHTTMKIGLKINNHNNNSKDEKDQN